LSIAPGPEWPTAEPPSAEIAMPMLAHSMGRTRERPTGWNEPRPTDMAPPAAIMPITGRPKPTPTASAAAMTAMHGNDARARSCVPSRVKTCRKASGSMEALT
jgi:hypothetical protein